MKSRTRARAVALQVLYEIDLTGHHPGDVLQQRVEDARAEGQNKFSPESEEFARLLVFGVSPLASRIDEVIAEYASDWPFDKIAAIDRNILRIAVWEFAISAQTPVQVAINEAVELAKSYGSDTAPRFVNGVLGSLADHQHILAKIFKEMG